ncbi:hypothetical protein [Tolypothrix sp. VBCCA 56010]
MQQKTHTSEAIAQLIIESEETAVDRGRELMKAEQTHEATKT